MMNMEINMESYELEYTTTPTVTVKFSLSGEDLIPNEITTLMGIAPSKAWSKGDPIPRKKDSRFIPRPDYPFGRWLFYAPCSKYDSFGVQINALLEALERLPSDVTDLIRKYNGEISIACSSGEDSIGFHFDASIIQRIYALGAEVDITVYPIRDEEG
jgi:hypothetical protein